jgi:hypothetical protein
MTEKRIARGPEGGLDFRALKGAIQGRDPGVLLGFYAEGAELRVVNPAHPRGHDFELRGRAEVGKYLRAVGDGRARRALKSGAVYGERAIAFVEECRYPDGAKVSVETMLEIEGGLIVRQIDAVRPAGDETVGGETRAFPGARR